MPTSPEDVLAFWFGQEAVDQAELMAHIRRWFMGGPQMDAVVIERFGPAVEAAVRGELDAWANTPRERLALVILLDQLTRNAFRDQARMYAGDPKAQRLAVEAFDTRMDRALSFPERLFLSMPLLHAEDTAMHDRLAPIADMLSNEAPPLYAPMMAMHREQVAKYRDVITRFGRFPHRNTILGRTSTDAEQAFLVDWAARAAPRGMTSG